MLAAILCKSWLPCLAPRRAAFAHACGKALIHAVGHEELCILRPAVKALRKPHFLLTQGIAVSSSCVLLMRRAEADHTVYDDERGSILRAAETFKSGADTFLVVRVGNAQHVPMVALEAAFHVLGKGEIGVSFDGDGVAVVDPAQIR